MWQHQTLVVPLAIGIQQASRRPSPSRSVSKAEWHGEERSKLWSGNENMLPCPGGGAIHPQKGPEREWRAAEAWGMGRMTRPGLC